jgi:hypothetical protein
MAIARVLLALSEALAGLAAVGWAGIAVLVVASDPPCDTAGCDTGIGGGELLAVCLLAAGGSALLVAAIVMAGSAKTRIPQTAWIAMIAGLIGAVTGLSLM